MPRGETSMKQFYCNGEQPDEWTLWELMFTAAHFHVKKNRKFGANPEYYCEQAIF